MNEVMARLREAGMRLEIGEPLQRRRGDGLLQAGDAQQRAQEALVRLPRTALRSGIHIPSPKKWRRMETDGGATAT